MHRYLKKCNLFSDRVLVILISFVTLFLQLISFATTWDGAKVYLDGIFPYASFLFAVAIQATAYFFSNSLRRKRSLMKIIALLMALFCSTYYSYIGIYNSVNSPLTYMQERYTRISDTLTLRYNEEMELRLSEIRTTVSDAISRITKEHQLLCTDLTKAVACLNELSSLENNISTGMRAPSKSSYADYEEYLAAYQAYIDAKSSGNNLEQALSREGILTSYGFSDFAQVNELQSEISGTLTTLYSVLGISFGEELGSALTALSTQVNEQIQASTLGISPDASLTGTLDTLLQALTLLNGSSFSVAKITSTLQQCAALSCTDFMVSFQTLAGENAQIKDALHIKGLLDNEIMTALLKLNKLLPQEDKISPTEEAYQIPDLYYVPILALTAPESRPMALFSLAMAGLVDGLSLLFAISLRGKRPLWNMRLLPTSPMDERYIPQIYASLPPGDTYTSGFRRFLTSFSPSPETEAQGYMLRASVEEIAPFSLLAALLCQINLAKILPDTATGKEYLLLKAGFVFWVNDMIYKELSENGGTP